MHGRSMVQGLVGGCLLVLAGGSGASAQEKQQWPPVGVSFYGDPTVPDISGLWLGTLTGYPGQVFSPGRGPADGRPPTYWSPWPLPYTPPYQKITDERAAARKNGRQLGDVSSQCLPFGLPEMLVGKVYPDEIVQTPGQVTFLMYNTFPVVVWTDGRAHPKGVEASYNGHSIGHWVGDTLMVDTVGLVGNSPLDNMRNPHSSELHIAWSIRKVAPDVMHLHVTLFDDLAFTEPVTTTNIWHRKTDAKWQVLDDASCFENNNEQKNGKTEDGFVKF